MKIHYLILSFSHIQKQTLVKQIDFATTCFQRHQINLDVLVNLHFSLTLLHKDLPNFTILYLLDLAGTDNHYSVSKVNRFSEHQLLALISLKCEVKDLMQRGEASSRFAYLQINNRFSFLFLGLLCFSTVVFITQDLRFILLFLYSAFCTFSNLFQNSYACQIYLYVTLQFIANHLLPLLYSIRLKSIFNYLTLATV